MIREATIDDIKELHRIRMSVGENVLYDSLLVTANHYVDFLTVSGKGWVYEVDENIAGFAIIDTIKNNIWALFVSPSSEGRGIGKQLQAVMLEWHFKQHGEPVWLSTAEGTRAEIFYRKTGWSEKGRTSNNEIIFEMNRAAWKTNFTPDQ